MPGNGWKWFKTVEDGWKQLKLVENDWKRLKTPKPPFPERLANRRIPSTKITEGGNIFSTQTWPIVDWIIIIFYKTSYGRAEGRNFQKGKVYSNWQDSCD